MGRTIDRRRTGATRPRASNCNRKLSACSDAHCIVEDDGLGFNSAYDVDKVAPTASDEEGKSKKNSRPDSDRDSDSDSGSKSRDDGNIGRGSGSGSGSDCNSDSDYDEDDMCWSDEDLDFHKYNGSQARNSEGSKGKKAAKKSKNTRRLAKCPLDQSERISIGRNDANFADGGNTARATKRRACSRQTNERLARMARAIDEDSDIDEDDAEAAKDSESYVRMPIIFKKSRSRIRQGGAGKEGGDLSNSGGVREKAGSNSDDSYRDSADDRDSTENSSGTSSDFDCDEESAPYEDDEDFINVNKKTSSNRNRQKGRMSVDEDVSIFTDDADSDENKSRSPPKPIIRTRNERRRRPATEKGDEEISSGADLDDFQTSSGRNHKPKTPSYSSQAPLCPSEQDGITMEALPHPHICCIAPDGHSRHCFALDTLYRVALMEPRRRKSCGSLSFKQPPHFRTEMEDELVDQIASRFGRASLIIEDHALYKVTLGTDMIDATTEDLGPDMAVDSIDDFLEQFQGYVTREMGSGDLYCCPICYVEGHAILRRGPKSDDDSVVEKEHNVNVNYESFQHDPMTILGSLDNYDYELASKFCFRKVSEVKRHLREDHFVDTSNIDGNDLYRRFKIREPDGLLQRCLNTCKGRGAGAMSSYWNGGNNEYFVFLRHLVSQRSVGVDNGGEDRDGVFHDFLQSFAKRGRRVWKLLSLPYVKNDSGEIDDFIVDDDDEEMIGTIPPPTNVFRDDLRSPEEEIIQSIRKKRSREGILDVSRQDEESELSSGESELEIITDKNLTFSSEEDKEEDKWLSAKKERRRKSFIPGDHSKKDISVVGGEDDTPLATKNTKLSMKKNRRRIAESDEDA